MLSNYTITCLTIIKLFITNLKGKFNKFYKKFIEFADWEFLFELYNLQNNSNVYKIINSMC